MRIFCLIGKSGSGKDTIMNRIFEQRSDLQRVVMSTTRPIRPGEVDGVNYNFVTDAQFRKSLLSGDVVEHRSYSTIHGLWTYFTTKSAFTGDQDFLTTSTIDAVSSLREYFGEENVIVVNVVVDDGLRLQRALTRELNGGRGFLEMCRRFLADSEDFNQVKLSTIANLKTVENIDIEQCVLEVNEIFNSSD